MRAKLKVVSVVGTAGVASLLAGFLTGPGKQATILTFLSVGQGDCAVFRSQGTTVLIDAGPANEYSDAGARLIAPKLRKMGVTRIDLAILSHPDSDHIGGLPALSKRFRIGKVAISGAFRDKPEIKKLISDCRLSTSQVMWTSGTQIAKLGSYKLIVYTPPNYAESDNDGSVVFRITDGIASCLFTGDLSSVAEDSMIGKNLSWNSQILKLSHHGSRFSTDDSWLNAVKPEYAVVSVGRNNNYGHPSTEVLRRLNLHQVAILRTDLQGDLKFIRTQKGFSLEDENQR